MYFCAANWVTSVTNLKTVDKGEHALTSKDKAGMASRMGIGHVTILSQFTMAD